MPRTPQTRGTCTFCQRELTRGGLSRHLAGCAARKEAIATSKHRAGDVLHLQIQDGWRGAFWLHLEMRASAPLSELDRYLRAIWLECCGHLSQFSLGAAEWGAEIGASRKASQVFRVGEVYSHIYDFGTTSHSIIHVRAVRKGSPLTRHPIFLMARNQPPDDRCQECGKPAGWLCHECMIEEEKPGLLCKKHAEAHPHEDYGEPIPLVNSPRAGMCGYSGPATPPY